LIYLFSILTMLSITLDLSSSDEARQIFLNLASQGISYNRECKLYIDTINFKPMYLCTLEVDSYGKFITESKDPHEAIKNAIVQFKSKLEAAPNSSASSISTLISVNYFKYENLSLQELTLIEIINSFNDIYKKSKSIINSNIIEID